MNYKVCTDNYMVTTSDKKLHTITIDAYEFNYAYKVTKDDIKELVDLDEYTHKERIYVASNGTLYFDNIESAERTIDIMLDIQEVGYGIQTRYLY